VITHDASVAAAAPRTVRLRDGSIVDGDTELERTGAAR
jgi:predicted ABC-type transport system involved in lysophospholipase L1 biosynthesis ATPase subunit